MLVTVLAAANSAAAFNGPVQLDLSIPMATHRGARERLRVPIPPGDATLKLVARNQRDGETVRIDLRFDYRISPGVIAFDELIEGIELETRDTLGNVRGFVSIDTQLINLNPNRARLFYRATLYYPTAGQSYSLRVRVFGNYE